MHTVVMLQRGTHLGPYEIVSALGAGATGEVYRARDPRLGRDVRSRSWRQRLPPIRAAAADSNGKRACWLP